MHSQPMPGVTSNCISPLVPSKSPSRSATRIEREKPSFAPLPPVISTLASTSSNSRVLLLASLQQRMPSLASQRIMALEVGRISPWYRLWVGTIACFSWVQRGSSMCVPVSMTHFLYELLMPLSQHDCNPNCELERKDKVMRFKVRRFIRAPEEITCYYADDYCK